MTDTRVICFANNKGGSGKSTTCSNVGYFMASEGKKILLIDGDMQLNLSLAYFDEEKVLSIAAGEKICTMPSKSRTISPITCCRRAMRIWISFLLLR